MRINFLLPQVTLSGGVKSTFEITNRLMRKGHEVRIIYPLFSLSHGYPMYNLQKLPFRLIETVYTLKRGNRVPWFKVESNMIRVPSFNEKFIPKADITVATWWENAYHVNQYSANKGVKVHIIRSYETWGGPKEKVDGSYKLPLNKIAISTYLKDIMKREFGVDDVPVIPNGLDLRKFYIEPEYKKHENIRVGLLYRRDTMKGMDEAIDAIQEIDQKFSGITFVLFGEKIKDTHLKQINNLNKAEIHGFCLGEDLRHIYNSLDIFVFPSRFEGFGNPPLEAMACGVATITTKVGGIPDYCVSGETAIVIPPLDKESITNSIKRLIEDPKERDRISKDGGSKVKNYTWDNTVLELEKVFTTYLCHD